MFNHHLPEDSPPYTGHLPQIRTNTRISRDAPSVAEIIDTIKVPPCNKAAGIDGIPAKFFKANHNQDACFLQPLIHEAWDNESFPSDWTDDIIVVRGRNTSKQIFVYFFGKTSHVATVPLEHRMRVS